MLIEPITYIFRTIDECDIRADVYRAESDVPTPVIVLLHGGGLIAGNRRQINMTHVSSYLDAGITVVSPDYRLAPETKSAEIVDDVVDAHRWVREQGPTLFNADPNRIATSGYSAGGYLTLMAGARVDPKPRALVAYYGYGDASGDWYDEPTPFYYQERIITKEEAWAGVGKSKVCEGLSGGRGIFYFYTRQQGIWGREVTGYDPAKDAEKLAAISPVKLITRDYPPTMLLHGTVDRDVPYQQSADVANELEKAGVEHKLILVRDKDHGFDFDATDPVAAETFEKVKKFLFKHLRVTA